MPGASPGLPWNRFGEESGRDKFLVASQFAKPRHYRHLRPIALQLAFCVIYSDQPTNADGGFCFPSGERRLRSGTISVENARATPTPQRLEQGMPATRH